MQQQVETKPDLINHPPHYQGRMEMIDVVQDKLTPEEFRGYLKGTLLYYVCRAGKKDGAPKLQDLKKAQWYLNKLVTTVQGEEDAYAKLLAQRAYTATPVPGPVAYPSPSIQPDSHRR